MMGVFAEFKRAIGRLHHFSDHFRDDGCSVDDVACVPQVVGQAQSIGNRHASSENSQDHRGVADWPFSVCASCGIGAGAF